VRPLHRPLNGEFTEFRFFFQLLQFNLHIVHVLEAALGVLAQAACEDFLQIARRVGRERAHWLRLITHHAGECGHFRIAAKGTLAGDHLVEHGTEAEDIRPPVERLALSLLGRHIRYGSNDCAVLRVYSGRVHRNGGRFFRRHGGGLGELGEPEVQHFDETTVGDHDIVRLEVPVDNACCRGIGYLNADLEHLGEAHAFPRYEMVESFATHVLHDDELRAGLGDNIVDGDDVRMIERGGSARLLYEALRACRVSDFIGGKDFDRNYSLQARVVGLINLTHAAGAKR